MPDSPPPSSARSCSHRPFCACRLRYPPRYAALGRAQHAPHVPPPHRPRCEARSTSGLGATQPRRSAGSSPPPLSYRELQLPPRPHDRISLDPRRQHGARGAAARSPPARACQHRGELQVQTCLPPPPSSRGFARRGAIPTHRLAPSRSFYSELRGCRRLFLCRFPLSHLLNKGKRGHRLAVSTHTLISGKGGGGAGGNGPSSPSGGAVTSTGGWSGPGIARGNLERGLHNPQVNKFPKLLVWQPPLRLLRDAWLSPALSEPTAAPQGAAEPGCGGRDPAEGKHGTAGDGESREWEWGPEIPQDLGGARGGGGGSGNN